MFNRIRRLVSAFRDRREEERRAEREWKMDQWRERQRETDPVWMLLEDAGFTLTGEEWYHEVVWMVGEIVKRQRDEIDTLKQQLSNRGVGA